MTGTPVNPGDFEFPAGLLAVPEGDLTTGDCDDGGPIQSYLYLNGTEVANGARTLAYMANASAGPCLPKFEVSPGCPCWIQAAEAAPLSGVFLSPALDPAPWYDAVHPESGDFLGVLIENESERKLFDGLATRTVTPRIGGLSGATIGPARQNPRVWQITAFLVSSSCQGAEYGRRWLRSVLGGACDECALGEMRVRSACPPCDGSENTRGEWYLYDVALTSGPAYSGPIDPDCCCVEAVTFEITAGNPYLYKAPVSCISGSNVVPVIPGVCIDFDTWWCVAPSALCCTLEPPDVGTLGTIITIAVGTGIANVAVSTYATCPPGSQAPSEQLTVPLLPAGSTLVIDSAQRMITFTDSDGAVTDGTPYIQLPDGQGIPWVEIDSCNPASCLCVGVGSYCSADNTSFITIQTQLRQA